jgi:hypothetical protein
MGSGLVRWARACAIAVVMIVLATTAAGAASQSGDVGIARAGVFIATDFPAAFQSVAGSNSSASETVKLAKGVDGCAPYVSLLKTSIPLPQAKSSRFSDGTRTISNDVNVFPSTRPAGAALALYAKPSVVGCLESLVEKQVRQDPDARNSIDDVVASLDRQDIAGLGDGSVVYEGNIVITGTDGTKSQIGVGSAAVQVGRAVDVVSYTTTGGDLTEVLSPAIDTSVVRLRTALARSA